MSSGGHAHLDSATGLLLETEGTGFIQAVPYVFGVQGLTIAGTTRFMMPGMGASSISEIVIEIHRAGKLRNLRCRALAGPGIAISDTITVRVNGSNSAVTATLTGVGTQSASDTTNSVTIASGDRISVSIITNAISVTSDMTATFEWTPL